MKNIVKAGLVGAAIAAAITVAPSAQAHAQPGCQTHPWGFLGLTKERIICDGPIQADGSWWRRRMIGVPAYYERPSTDCSYGSYSSHCSYSDGGYVSARWDDDETYVVRPETVLPDEPGHLG